MNRSQFAGLCTLLSFAVVAAATCADEPARATKDKWQPVVYVHRHPKSGTCSLKANGYLMHRRVGKARTFTFRSLWLYDHKTKKWVKVDDKVKKPVVVEPVEHTVYSPKTDPTLLKLPKRVALFWVQWLEDKHQVNALAVSGPVLCNDIRLGKTPKGMVAACVPFPDHALATFVPDPEIHCRRQGK